MKPVASSQGIHIYCPENGRFSFFNSPYPAHSLYTGIDIYPNKNFGDVAPSPVMGKVTRIKRVKCPEGKMFKSSSHDYVILLRSLENPERWIKILHLEPAVEVGETLEPGDGMGVLLRSGFFDFWTDPHIHVEVRKPSDPLRARGGFKIKRSMRINAAEPLKDLRGTVIESRPEYSLIVLRNSSKQGVTVELNGKVGLLDGGVPHYGWIGIHVNMDPPSSGVVRLCNREIGTIRSVYSNMCIAKHRNPTFTLNGKTVRLSLYVYPSSTSLVKVIPRRPGELTLKKLEETTITIN